MLFRYLFEFLPDVVLSHTHFTTAKSQVVIKRSDIRSSIVIKMLPPFAALSEIKFNQVVLPISHLVELFARNSKGAWLKLNQINRQGHSQLHSISSSMILEINSD